MFSAERPHFRRAGAAIIAAILAATCAMAQENPSRGGTAPTTNGTGANAPPTAAPTASPPDATPAAIVPQGAAKKGARADRTPSVELTPQVGDFIGLPDKKGQPRGAIYGAELEQFVEFFKA